MIDLNNPDWIVAGFPFTETEISEALDELGVPREKADQFIQGLKDFRRPEISGVHVPWEVYEFLGRSNRLRQKVAEYQALLRKWKREQEEFRIQWMQKHAGDIP